VVQDPSDAAFPEMPTTALTRLEPDHVVGLAGMPRVETLTEIHRQPCSITWPLRRALMSAWGHFQKSARFKSDVRSSPMNGHRAAAGSSWQPSLSAPGKLAAKSSR
jgi:hypothetical protein